MGRSDVPGNAQGYATHSDKPSARQIIKRPCAATDKTSGQGAARG